MTSRSLAGWAIRQPVQSNNMWPLKWKSAGKWVRASTPPNKGDGEFVAKDLAFYLPSRFESRGDLDARNRKEVSGAA
jgi:hypothetical protein